jgi:two-component system, OmpR family, sensor histidine kinase KdpD
MTVKSTKGSGAARISIYGSRKLSSGASLTAAVALVAVATLLCEQTRPYLSPINMVMAYLLAVVLAAVFLGRKPAVLTAFLGVLAFDFFFVPPRFSFTISDKEYLLTFLALFTVGIVISSLVAKARESLEALRVREAQTETLYQLSRSLAAAANTAEIIAAVKKNIESSLSGELAVFLPKNGELVLAAKSASLPPGDFALEVAAWSFRSRRWAGHGTESYSGEEMIYIPIKALAQTLGVLGIRLDRSENTRSQQTHRLLDAFASQTAIALERGRLMEKAQEAQILTARENLERALLNSISHDLRTPLAAITGALSAVLDEGEKLREEARGELLENARVEAERLNRFVGNLLDMTRLEAGALRPRLEPCDVQDLIGCALGAIEKRVAAAQVEVQIEPDLPLVPMDLPLMVQVMVNLLDNALKYAPPEKGLLVASHRDNNHLYIEVADRGPGIPEDQLPRIFEKFFRTVIPETVGGTGLGLSICKGIVEAHGGAICAGNRKGGGLGVMITLPLGEPLAQEGGEHDH